MNISNMKNNKTRNNHNNIYAGDWRYVRDLVKKKRFGPGFLHLLANYYLKKYR